jgi:hypothetical protein
MALRFHSPQYVGTGGTGTNGATDIGASIGAQNENLTHDLRNISGVSTAGLRSVQE